MKDEVKSILNTDLLKNLDKLFLNIQFYSHYLKQIYDKKVDFIRKSNESDENMNRCLIKKADALTLNGEY